MTISGDWMSRPGGVPGARRPAAWPVVLALLMASAVVPARAGGTLDAIRLEPEGRLLRITLTTSGVPERYTLMRQGPPEHRDLVLRLPGFVSGLSAPVDTGDWLMPIDVTREVKDDGAVLKVTFGRVGDDLVQVSQEGAALSVVIIPPETRTGQAAAYRIGSGDVLQIDVFGHDDLNKTLKVSPTGLINFPLIGNIRVAGRTVDEVAEEVTRRLEEDYLRDPHVTVSVWEYLSQWVNVIGEVAQPGRYYMTGPTTLIDALSQAGGIGRDAAGEILITRSPDQGDPSSAGEVHRIATARLFSAEGTALNLTLRPGDVVNVLGAPAKASDRP